MSVKVTKANPQRWCGLGKEWTLHMAREAELKAAGAKSMHKDYEPSLYKIRHSYAHVLAQAVTERFPNAPTATSAL